MQQADYMSFLVRLWRDEPGTSDDGWHGEIEHIQSGARWHFGALDEILAFLQQAALAPQLITLPDQDAQ